MVNAAATPPFEFLLLTNEPDLAVEAERAGIQRVLVDLERRGKAERQRGRGYFLSDHKGGDIANLRAQLSCALVMTRVDSWSVATPEQVEAVIAFGAQGVMLPLTESASQAQQFVEAVNSRALVSLLVETKAGLAAFEEIARVDGVDELHIGLNDLALTYGSRTIFDCLAARRLDEAASAARRHGRRFGFGGVTDPAQQGLPIAPDILLGEQARLGSSVFWLGRSFRQSAGREGKMAAAIERVRSRLQWWRTRDEHALLENHHALTRHVRRLSAVPAETHHARVAIAD